MDFGLYVHIPFCERICPYCDFNTYATNIIPEQEYCDAIIKQLEDSFAYKQYNLKSIYFGGGTPSLFKIQSIEKILATVLKKWSHKDLEITIEINPEHINNNYISSLKSLNFTRISLGVQSLKETSLKFLGRKHSFKQIESGINIITKNNLNNFNMDFIFGLPNENINSVRKELEDYLNFKPTHLSCYQLTIESGTAFSIKYPSKTVVSDEYSSECYLEIINLLENKSYKQYEISNFAKKGFESKHNLLYWTHKPYLGLGAGAHSLNIQTNSVERWQNIRNFKEYIANPNQKVLVENLSDKELMFDYLFTSLRKNVGISRLEFKENFNKDILEVFPKLILFENENLISINSNISLTKKGLLLYDSILEELSDL